MAGCTKPYTIKDKWLVSILLGVLFMIIGSPITYGITNSIFGIYPVQIIHPLGLILHAILFVLIVRVLMR